MTLEQQEPIIPVTPREARNRMISSIPGWVIKVFNDMLSEKASGRGPVRIRLIQKDVMERLLAAAPPGTVRQNIFDRGWLDIEPLFEKVGWKVKYDKPGYNSRFNENYDASWTFDEKRNDD